MHLAESIHQCFMECAQTTQSAAEFLVDPIAEGAERMVRALLSDGKILACGSGGSGLVADLFTAALVSRLERERPGLAAISLGAAPTLLTAVASHQEYGQVFARQVAALGHPGDILLAVSGSGNSRAVVEAVRAAHDKELGVVALTGRDGGDLGNLLRDDDLMICVPAETATRIREVHVLVIHCLCDSIDNLLLGV